MVKHIVMWTVKEGDTHGHPAHVEVAEYIRNVKQSRAAIDYEY